MTTCWTKKALNWFCFAGLLRGCQTKHSKRRGRENPTFGHFPSPLLFIVLRSTFISNILPFQRCNLACSIIHELFTAPSQSWLTAVELSRDHWCRADRLAGEWKQMIIVAMVCTVEWAAIKMRKCCWPIPNKVSVDMSLAHFPTFGFWHYLWI